MGYAPSLGNPIVNCLSGPGGDEWWAVHAQEAGLTAEQAQQISDVRKKYVPYIIINIQILNCIMTGTGNSKNSYESNVVLLMHKSKLSSCRI